MNMRVVFTLLFAVFASGLWGQILDPVSWKMHGEHVKDNEFDLIFTATMDPGWSIYSQFTDEGGPVPTSFNFDEGNHYTRQGKVAEKGEKKEGMDPLFGVNVIKFAHGPVVFKQRVTVNNYDQPIKGYLEYMTCDDEQCLPPAEVDFNFKLTPPNADRSGATPPQTDDQQPATAGQKTESAGTEAQADAPLEQAGGLPSASVAEPSSTDGTLLDPVHWKLNAEALPSGDYRLTFTATMDGGWNIYSQHTEDNGPIPTTFFLENGDEPTILPTEESGALKEGLDAVFGVIVKKFEHGPVSFTATVPGDEPLRGFIDYMTCDDGQCIPAQLPFSVDFQPLALSLGEGEAAPAANLPTAEAAGLFPIDKAVLDKEPVGECSGENDIQAGKSNWQIFILGFFGGFLALLTPCVFPMIPLTVSFFTKQSQNRRQGISKAALYGFFIFFVYLLLSLPFHLMDTLNPDILNDISTNVWLNLFFFAIFLFFAFSFFGYYELTVPESWTNRASRAEGVGGLAGIFFMALTLALVSFSCTGPILGSLLAGALSSNGGAMQLTAGMGGFGLALALPFALFAAFPGMMQSLPKSGGWLNTVKVVLGFLELALAFKFLSNADLVSHWGLLKIEPFLALWILIFLGLGLYLFGRIKFPHDSPIKKLSPVRIGLGVLSLAFVVYLFLGFRVNERSGSYQPLTLLSGLAPPVCYSIWQPCDCPQGLECFKDLEEGLAYARANNKPILLDFTGYACVNCRKMEEHVWPEPEVIDYLRNDYVLISLYVDDKKQLEEEIEVIQSHNGQARTLRTVGNKWSYFQTEYFQINAQPYYVLLSPEGRPLNQPADYTPNPEEYGEFLRCGLENFQRLTEMRQQSESQLGSRE